jgi:formylglycine-generating enzyme
MILTKLKLLCFTILVSAIVLNIVMPVPAAKTISDAERLQKGIEYYKNGKYDDAIFNLEIAKIQISDDDKERLWKVYIYAGSSYWRLGETDESKKLFRKANEIFKDRLPDPDIISHKIVRLFEEASAQKKRGNPAAKPNMLGIAKLEKGIECYENGKYDDAIFNLEMAKIEIPEDDKKGLWKVHVYAGSSYWQLGEKKESRLEFIKANEIFKNRLPDRDVFSRKIVKLFKKTIKRAGSWESGTYTESITGMKFVFVKGGCFEMGDVFGDGEGDQRPVHMECVDSFYIGKYEVTQRQWKKVTGNNPSKYKLKRKKSYKYPVENVCWNDVRGFIKKLNQKTGEHFRLPTEAEWEYAARSGGREESFAGFSSKDDLYRYANFCDNNCTKDWKTRWQDDDYKNTSPVGSYKPNGLGIYDMTGNVWEWCQDVYGFDTYGIHQSDNSVHMEDGFFRVFRGGGWGSKPEYLRAYVRDYNPSPDVRSGGLGLRLVRTVD